MSANPFYIQPAGDMSQGLAGLSSVLKDVGEQRRLREEQKAQEEAMAQAQTEVQQAVESGDTDQINQVAIKYPMFAETVYGGMKIKNDEQKGRFAADLRQLVTAPPDQIPTILERRIQKIDEMGGDSTQSRDELAEFLANPEGQIKNFQFAYAAVAPENEYKAWRESIAPKKAPETREIKRDGEIVTEQFNPQTGQFEVIATANRFEPKEVKPNEIRTIKRGTTEVVEEFSPTTGKWNVIAESDTVENAQRIAEVEQKAKDRLAESKMDVMNQSKQAKAAIVSGKVDEAITLVDDWMTTGFFGQILNKIGGTDARNLAATLDTIKANLGFTELQAMRDASPTGGALGSVAVRELDLLQSTIASLDQAQDDATLLKSLKEIKTHMQNWANTTKAAIGTETVVGTGPENTTDVTTMSDEELLR